MREYEKYFMQLKDYDYGWDKEELILEDGINLVYNNINDRIEHAKSIIVNLNKDKIKNKETLEISILLWIYKKQRNLYKFKEAKETLLQLKKVYNLSLHSSIISDKVVSNVFEELSFLENKDSYVLFVLGESHDYEIGNVTILYNPKTNKLAEILEVEDIDITLSLFNMNESFAISYLFSYNIDKYGYKEKSFYENQVTDLKKLMKI